MIFLQNRKIAAKSFFLAALFLAAVLPGCSREPARVEQTREMMGTFVTVIACHGSEEKARQAVEKAFTEMERIEAAASKYRKNSELSRVNASATSPARISGELFGLLSEAEEISRLTDGAFDVTVGPLTDVWDRAREDGVPPRAAALEAAKSRVGYEKLELDAGASTARLAVPGMKIDLGGIAKGYAADRAVAAMAESGVESALVNAGGDIRALGSKPGGEPWRVALRDPEKAGGMVSAVDITGGAVTTSGDYEKYLEAGGKKYSHIFDPRTGGTSDCVSATVIAPSAAIADALSTAVCVLGPEEGIAMIEGIDGIDAEAMIIDTRGETRRSSGFSRYETETLPDRDE